MLAAQLQNITDFINGDGIRSASKGIEQYHLNVLLWITGAAAAMVIVVAASMTVIRGDLKTPPWQTLRETE